MNRFNLKKIHPIIKKNIELFMVFLLVIISVSSIKIYTSNKKEINQNYIDLVNNIFFKKSLKHVFDNLKPKYINIEHKILAGETFDEILKNYQIPETEIRKIKKNITKNTNLNKLKINETIKFIINRSDTVKITYFLFPISRTEKIQLTRNLTLENFEKKTIITNLNKKVVFKEGKILQSFYKTAINLKIQPNTIIEFARLYGFQVDFQRDIRKYDTFQILYEVYENNKGQIIELGNIIYTDLNLSGQNNSLYYFDEKNVVGYYDQFGKSAEKALMKTPINGARLSSAFGMRKHPISGFNKLHKGTDFAAPSGTPIMASGHGKVVRAKWCGGGGNCIQIRHNSTYSTVYAHMLNFAKGINVGTRVKQGQIIGFVGSTGNSTGPHLHYEIIENNVKINSQKLKLPSGKTLAGDNRKLFEIRKIKLDVLKSELILGLN
tara:strand:+ start:159 stop:1466 length:1308 start_codon:yes stop_codon:yes gene_type:complete